MVVAIHGLGATPENFAPLFENFPEATRILLPRGPMEHGEGYSWFAMAAGTDRTAQLREAAGRLAKFVEVVSGLRPTTGKPIVTGFSQGGMLSFALALEHSESIGGAIPLAGMIPQSMLDELQPAKLPRPRMVALHGGADPIFGPEGIRRSVNALSAKGIKTELYVYPGVGHQVSNKMRDDIYIELAAMIAPAQADD